MRSSRRSWQHLGSCRSHGGARSRIINCGLTRTGSPRLVNFNKCCCLQRRRRSSRSWRVLAIMTYHQRLGSGWPDDGTTWNKVGRDRDSNSRRFAWEDAALSTRGQDHNKRGRLSSISSLVCSQISASCAVWGTVNGWVTDSVDNGHREFKIATILTNTLPTPSAKIGLGYFTKPRFFGSDRKECCNFPL